MIWIIAVILGIILIVSVSKGNKKKDLEIKKLQNEVQPKYNTRDELIKLQSLLDSKAITPKEYEIEKKNIFNRK